jgi:hypothetical protein
MTGEPCRALISPFTIFYLEDWTRDDTTDGFMMDKGRTSDGFMMINFGRVEYAKFHSFSSDST